MIPPSFTIPIHSFNESSQQVYLRVSLWGTEYSQKVLVAETDKRISQKKRILLEQRKNLQSEPSACLSLDIVINNDLITIRAPFQFVNKTPFPLYVGF